MDKIDKSIEESLSSAAEAIKETSSEVLKIISGIAEDLDSKKVGLRRSLRPSKRGYAVEQDKPPEILLDVLGGG